MPNSHPLDWIVLKVYQLCNLDCSYCYVYNRGDSSWSTRPKEISNEVLVQLAKRISEHCQQYKLKSFNIELHGGEPLLLGLERMQELVNLLRTSCTTNLIFHLQTNGTLLDERWIDLFDRNAISFGISLDGPPDINDKHRVFRSGRGSSSEVASNLRGLSILPGFQKWFGGILCVISDPKYDPKIILEWLGQIGVKRMDFLLPDGNYANLPQRWQGAEEYGDFLCRAWEAWIELGAESPKIRTFEYMFRGLTGERITLDALGGNLEGLCVVETDGTIGVSDVARICSPMSLDKMNLFSNQLDERTQKYELASVQSLSQKCTECKYLSACNGGYLPHRYDGNSFQNPSLYCEALYRVSDAIFRRVNDAIAGATGVENEPA